MSGQCAPVPVALTPGRPGYGDPHAVSGPFGAAHAARSATRGPAAGVTGHLPAEPSASCALSPHPESVKAGRDFTRATLHLWEMPDLTDVAELVVSELVTNALRHGLPSAGGAVMPYPVRLRLLAQERFVTCMVTDPGRDIPVRRESGPDAESGRGLTVVESCCVRWGWHLLEDGGKVVWALMRPPL